MTRIPFSVAYLTSILPIPTAARAITFNFGALSINSLEIGVSERVRIQWKGAIILKISVRGRSGAYWISISFSLRSISRPIW